MTESRKLAALLKSSRRNRERMLRQRNVKFKWRHCPRGRHSFNPQRISVSAHPVNLLRLK